LRPASPSTSTPPNRNEALSCRTTSTRFCTNAASTSPAVLTTVSPTLTPSLPGTVTPKRRRRRRWNTQHPQSRRRHPAAESSPPCRSPRPRRDAVRRQGALEHRQHQTRRTTPSLQASCRPANRSCNPSSARSCNAPSPNGTTATAATKSRCGHGRSCRSHRLPSTARTTPYAVAEVADPSASTAYSFTRTDDTLTRRNAGGTAVPFPPGDNTVKVVYEAGMTSVPGNVRLAAVLTSSATGTSRRSKAAARRSPARPPTSLTSCRRTGYAIPNRVRELLSPHYRIPGFA
jgi:hypothetical protein